VAVGPTGDVWVSAGNAPTIFHFSGDGSLKQSHTVAGATGGISALALGRDGTIYAASSTPAAVLTLDPATGASHTYAVIPDLLRPCAPPAVTADCDGSLIDTVPAPSALAFDVHGNLFVADAAQGAIWLVPAGGGTAKQWSVQRNWTNPMRPAGPTGLAIDGAGKLVIAVRSTLTEDEGVVFVQDVAADGTPGALTQLTKTGAASRPAGITLGRDGRVYVALGGLGRVLILGPDGKELGGAPADAGRPLDTPAGIAFRGQSVLVAAHAPSRPDGGRVFRLPVGQLGGVVYAP
jgi:sugar lactone lactonase YvrE